MTDVESFLGLETGEGQISPEALEAFRERMRKNAQQLKALQKAEQKQKKKEDKLAQILNQFLQDQSKHHLAILVSYLLKLNVPASFVLSVILLGNESLQEEIGIHIAVPSEVSENREASQKQDNAIAPWNKETFLPLEIRLAIDLWGKNIFETAQAQPYKILGSAVDIDKKIKPPVYRLAGAVLLDYLKKHDLSSDTHRLEEFCKTMLHGIMRKIEENLNKAELKDPKQEDAA